MTVSSGIDILGIRGRLGRKQWMPAQQFGSQGWHMSSTSLSWTVVVTAADGWVHASLTGYDDVPSYELLTELRLAVFGGGCAYQVFLADDEPRSLHLWGRADGDPALPAFTQEKVVPV